LYEALGFEVEKSADRSYDDCSPQEKQLLDLLETPMPRDELIRLSKLSTSEANVYISLLEMKGHIKESLGEVRII
jgi:hypothetical protein